MNLPIRVVVLDCDGVIIESVDVKTRAFAACFAEYGPEARAYMVDYHLRHGGISRYEKFRHFFSHWLKREITGEEMGRLSEMFTRNTLEEVLKAPLVPGALEFLEAFQHRLPLYVASGAPQDELRIILEHKGLAKYFKEIYGSPTTKPEILRLILAQEEVLPGEILMVGDSSTDLLAAEAVGARFVGPGPVPGPAGVGDLRARGAARAPRT